MIRNEKQKKCRRFSRTIHFNFVPAEQAIFTIHPCLHKVYSLSLPHSLETKQ